MQLEATFSQSYKQIMSISRTMLLNWKYQAIQTLKSFSAALYTGSVILAIKREKWKYIDIFNLKQNTFHST